MQSKLPYLIRIAWAFPVHFKGYTTYLVFFKSKVFSHSWVIFLNKKRILSSQTEYSDSEFEALAQKKLIALEFLISIWVGWLPFRSSNQALVKVYNPHICACQFGYDQDVPKSVLNFTTLSKNISILDKCWHALLRYGTNSFFSIPSCKWVPQCSHKYLS